MVFSHLQTSIPSSSSVSMAAAIVSRGQFKGCPPPLSSLTHLSTHENFNISTRRKADRDLKAYSSTGFSLQPIVEVSQVEGTKLVEAFVTKCGITESLVVMDLDPATAQTLITYLGPLFSGFGFLFILRIVMSWYPKLPVDKFPYIIAYAPTEPILSPTRKVIPPVGGVDVTPVVWFGLISFLSEILIGPQGLLVLLSQKISQ